MARHRAGAGVLASAGVELPADSAFEPGLPPAGPEWSGTSKLKYAYRVSGVQIETGGVPSNPLDSAWWWSTVRPGVLAERRHAAVVGRGALVGTAHLGSPPVVAGARRHQRPAGTRPTASRLCDPALLPLRACAFGVAAVRIDNARVELRNDASATLPSRFAWLARDHFGLIERPAVAIARAAAAGRCARAWGALPSSRPCPGCRTRRPASTRWQSWPTGSGRVTMQLSGAYEPALVDPSLTLLVLPWERDPVRGVVFCIDFSNPSSVGFTTDGFDFKGLHFVDLGTDGLVLTESTPPANVPELRFTTDGVRIELPLPVHGVRIDVWSVAGSAPKRQPRSAAAAERSSTPPSAQRTGAARSPCCRLPTAATRSGRSRSPAVAAKEH